MNIKIKCLQYIIDHIEETLIIIKFSYNIKDLQRCCFNQINIILRLLKEIKKYTGCLDDKDSELSLKDEELLQKYEQINKKNKQIKEQMIQRNNSLINDGDHLIKEEESQLLKTSLLKLKLLYMLVNNKKTYFSQYLNLEKMENLKEIFTKEKIFKIISNINNENVYDSFLKLLKEIKLNYDKKETKFIEDLETIIPCPAFISKDYSIFNYWIEIIINIIKNGNYLSLYFGEDNQYEFYDKEKSKKYKLKIVLVFLKRKLFLHSKSYLILNDNNNNENNKLSFDKNNKSNKNETYIFIKLINELFNDEFLSQNKLFEKYNEFKNNNELITPYSPYFNLDNYFMNDKEKRIIDITWNLIYNLDKSDIENINKICFNYNKDINEIFIILFDSLTDDYTKDIINKSNKVFKFL